jgi:Putative Actinobacterial Holin-X, holin superfamily III
MAGPQEIPQLTTELIDMSREYLRQETLEPAKALGKHAGMGVGGAVVLSFGSFLLVLAVYFALRMAFPDTEWFEVLARFLTAVAAASAAGLAIWRMQRDDYPG